jgi:hypothetical protein
MDSIKRLVIHPFLWSVYPILMLVAYNIQSVTTWMVYRPIVVALIVAGILFGILSLILRNAQKAGLIVTLLMLLFFSYGHVFGILKQNPIFGVPFGRHSLMVPLWLVILVAGTVLILRSRRDLLKLTEAFNIVAIIVILFPLVQIVDYKVRTPDLTTNPDVQENNELPLPVELSNLKASGEDIPDIYFIVLDAYGRDDTLERYFKFDNSAFLNSLEDLDFYVARCSQSNYSETQLSLASSLNMNYLTALGVEEKQGNDQATLDHLIDTNFTRRVLTNLGYKTVSIASGYETTEWVNADVYLSANSNPGKANYFGGINSFESLIMSTSGGIILYRATDYLPDTMRSFLDAAYNEHRDTILYALNALENVPSLPGHKFVFVHILAPHEPFVFGPNGEYVGRKYPFTLNHDLETLRTKVYDKGYRDQVNYLNKRMIPILQKIIANSSTPPIIVLQGDHGPLLRVTSENARLTNLIAFYLPEGGDKNLYPTISSVNTFRIIFNTYFGANLSLLDDASYYFDRGQIMFRPTPNQRLNCQAAGTGN